MSSSSSSSPSPSASSVKQEPPTVPAFQPTVDDMQLMRDHIRKLEVSLAEMRLAYGLSVVPALADPPPPPPRLDAGSPAVDSSTSAKSESQDFRSFHSSDPERQANPPRHSTVAGPRRVTPHPAAVSSYAGGYDDDDLPDSRSDRKYAASHDDRGRSPRRAAQFDDASSSSSMSSSSSSSMKLPSMRMRDPPTFDGNVLDPNKLEDYITAMERYLRVYKTAHHTERSYDYTSTSLTDRASRWLRQIETRDPGSITSWDELKAELRKTFTPMSISQLAFGRLQKVTYTKDVPQLNHEFMEQLHLLPEYNNAQFDKIMVQMYLEALSKGTGTRFMATHLRMQISANPKLSLREAMDVVLLAEANMGREQRREGAAATALPYRPFKASSSSSSSSSENWRSRFSRSTPVKQPSFSTPQAKLHNAAADSFDDYVDDRTDAAAELDREMDGDMNEESNRGPTFHADVEQGDVDANEGGDPFAGVPSDIALNMIRFARRFGDLNNLSADELDRRRRNNLCFNCGGVGHRSRDCKKPRPTPQGAGAAGGSSNKSQPPNKRHFQ